jgi:hypothetical protein
MEAFATVFAKDLTIVEGFRLRQPLVTVFTTSEKASDFARRVAMVRSSGDASSVRAAVAERPPYLGNSDASAGLSQNRGNGKADSLGSAGHEHNAPERLNAFAVGAYFVRRFLGYRFYTPSGLLPFQG